MGQLIQDIPTLLREVAFFRVLPGLPAVDFPLRLSSYGRLRQRELLRVKPVQGHHQKL